MEQTQKKLLVFVYGPFLFVLAAVAFVILNLGDILDARPPEFSDRNMLQALWHQYKMEYLEPGTLRSLDKQQDNITTSEGQSYTMLRSVWLDDKATFDAAWQWTKDNIQRRDDNLMAWLFGERADGSYGILHDRGGQNTATDADVDIALALLFASRRWNDERYFGDAIVIIRSIWEREVLEIGGRPYLAANDIEKRQPKDFIISNPSYFAPYAYKIFEQVDPTNDWLGLAETSYEVALRSMELPLDKERSAGLPPDWIAIDKRTAEVTAVPTGELSTNYSFDALRTPWRFAVDYQWTGDERAKAVLEKMSFLSDEWDGRGSVAVSYSHDGARVIDKESLAMYGGALGYFMFEDRGAAKEIYREKLERAFDTNESKWAAPQSYYDENWAWFGMALYQGQLRDLWTQGEGEGANTE